MSQRRLTAILSADVVGYSRLMGGDEAGTLAALKTHRKELFDPEIAKRGGRIAKLMGDGVLVEFASVVDAVEAAVAVQTALAEPDGPIKLRIGINLGDIIVDGEEIYGDGVNIAARLEGLAETGGICVSSVVQQSVGNRVDATFVDDGLHTLKNIEHPVQVFRWKPDGAVATVPVTANATPATRANTVPTRNRTLIIAGTALAIVGGVTAAMMLASPSTPDVPVVPERSVAADAEAASAVAPADVSEPTAPVSEESSAGKSSEPVDVEMSKPAEVTAEATDDVAALTSTDSATSDVADTKTKVTAVPGAEIAALLAGKSIRGGRDFGGQHFVLKLDGSGGFRGEVSFDDSFGSTGVDTGRWRVRGDRFCLNFMQFGGGQQICSIVMRKDDDVAFMTQQGAERKWTLSD